MRLWPVVTGVAIALTLVACKSPTPPKGVQPITGFDASHYLGNGMKSPDWKIASSAVWNRSPRRTASVAMAVSAY